MCECYSSPINCILPPEMVKNIKVKGGKKERRWAEELEVEADRYRSLRSRSIPTSAFKPVPKVKDGDKGSKIREVYDVQQPNSFRKEGDPKCGNPDVDAAFEFAGAVYDFFFDQFRRDSLDGKGFKMVARVNYRIHPKKPYPNAQWDLTDKEMKYGEGCLKKDKERYGEGYGIYNSFSRDLSISAHEHAHGIIQFSGGLEYHSQAGALNESIADVFASMVVQYAGKKNVHEASWLIGENVFHKQNRNYVSGMALRSLKAPGQAYDHKVMGKDIQPFHMDAYDPDRGPHVNSGIPNHAFYLLAIQLGGYSWEKAGRIWYNSLEKADNPLIRFDEWANLTVQEAIGLFGSESEEALLTRRAWKLVGLNI